MDSRLHGNDVWGKRGLGVTDSTPSDSTPLRPTPRWQGEGIDKISLNLSLQRRETGEGFTRGKMVNKGNIIFHSKRIIFKQLQRLVFRYMLS